MTKMTGTEKYVLEYKFYCNFAGSPITTSDLQLIWLNLRQDLLSVFLVLGP
jgi:hypothetical protein